VSLNGTVIPFSLYSVGGVDSNGAALDTYACNISAFAGHTDVTLEFEKLVHDPANKGNHGMVDLDAIQFSSISTPEPSTIVLLAISILSNSGDTIPVLEFRRIPGIPGTQYQFWMAG
jgi:hypothetical protein